MVNRFLDSLDSFCAELLEEREELEAPLKVLEVILWLFLGLSFAEFGFNVNYFFTFKNQSQMSFKSLRIAHHDHICKNPSSC